MRKYLFSVITIILGILLLVGIWYLFFKGKKKAEILPEVSSTLEVPEVGEVLTKKLVKVNQKDVLGYFQKDKYLYYFDTRGALYFYDLEENQLFEEEGVRFENLVDFKVSFDKKKLILVWKEGERKRFSLFDLESKKTSLLPEVDEVNFSLFDSNKGITFKEEKEKSSLIGEIDFLRNKIRPIYKIDAYQLEVFWPQRNLVAFWDKPTGLANSSFFFLDLNTKRVERFLDDLGKTKFSQPKGLMVKFFKDGSFLVADPSFRRLKFFSEKRKLRFDFDFFTFPEKCQKNENYLICAVPLNLEKEAILPDDWYKGKLNFSEILYKINLETGLKEKIYQTELSDIVEIEVLSENKISFLDRVTASVYLLNY